MKKIIGIGAFIVVLLTMPIGHAMMVLLEKIFGEEHQFLAAFVLGLLGIVLLILGVRNKNETKATIYGLFASLFVWTGWIEFSFVYIAQRFKVDPLVENGEIVTKPEYLIMPSSIGLLGVILFYFLFNDKTRCTFFNWLQQNLGLSPYLPKKANNSKPYAMITFIELIMIVWVFYILLLLVYDDQIFGDRHPVAYITAFGSLFWSLYLMVKLVKIKKFGYAIRYAIPTVVIFWNFVEIVGRWNFFKEFWIHPLEYKFELLLILFILIGLTIVFYFENKKAHLKQKF